MKLIFPLINIDKNLYVFKENDNPVYDNQPVWYNCRIEKIIDPENRDPVCIVKIGAISYDNKSWHKIDPLVTAFFRASKIDRINNNAGFCKDSYPKTFLKPECA